jgi:hypothetical protein
MENACIPAWWLGEHEICTPRNLFDLVRRGGRKNLWGEEG